MNYRWTQRQEPDENTVSRLSEKLKIPKSLTKVLVARGIDTFDKASKFFDPSLKDLYDPFLMDGMEKASERIVKAIQKGEPIWIHGDYDVDGTGSTSMTLMYLREVGANAHYYIPDRFHEGYGFSKNSVSLAKELGVKVVITVDVGITSYEPMRFAKENGIDVIICDHHEPGTEVPDVFVIVDPMTPGNKYPFKHLAACGVAFKLIQAVGIKLDKPEIAMKYLDFVAIASAADMVPLVDENRILVKYGLKLLNEKPRPGIKGLIYCTRLKEGAISASNIVYAMAPLINAAGRLGDACRAVEMMIQEDEFAAFRIAQELEQENRRRRVFDETTFEQAIVHADKWLMNPERRSIVLHYPKWHAGVIGIVASRLVDRYHLPTVLLTSIDGLAKGSARSISNFDIHGALKMCDKYLIEYGGHKHAAGLSIEEKDVAAFAEDFDAIAREKITNDMVVPEYLIDAELKLNDLSPAFLKVLSTFAPYGYDNFKPIFISKDVTSANNVKIIGNQHLKFRAYQSHFVIDAIGYQLANKINIVNSRKPFTIIYNLEATNFNGYPTPQLRLKDIRPDNEF